jgi:hypothetical protein
MGSPVGQSPQMAAWITVVIQELIHEQQKTKGRLFAREEDQHLLDTNAKPELCRKVDTK